MLFLLLSYAIAQSGFGEALPTPSIEQRDSSSGDEPIQTRTIWNIVWSCLVTIFLCTWVSLHPNISSTPEKSGAGWFNNRIWKPLVDFLTYKLPLFLWALLVPEYILAWAIRQYIVAGKIQRKVPGWTRTHGFFLIMGGFQLFEHPDHTPQPMNGETDGMPLPSIFLDPGKFVRILGYEDVSQHNLETIVRFTTEQEIKDKGKSDGIAKAIVLLQTSWFIIQCVARRVRHLPLTELEIVTLAYTMMNFFLYLFWWDKPRDVGCPIRVYKDVKTKHDPPDERETGLGGIVNRIMYYVVGVQDDFFQLSQECKVPMFWSGNSKVEGQSTRAATRATLGTSILGTAFGAIHFIAWSYDFPSYVELIFWRISCVAIVAVPVFCAVFCGISVIGTENKLMELIFRLSGSLLVLSAWLYLVARIATIVVACTTLRSLPSDAFRVVDWTSFIPHI